MAWIPQLTADGSYTFFSTTFGETFHSGKGARTEAFEKYAIATQLATKATQPEIHVLDVCYGLGYNTAAALETIWGVNPDCRVVMYGLELDATVPLGAAVPEILQGWSPRVQAVMRALARGQRLEEPGLQAQLLFGDARQTLLALVQQGFEAEAIYLDPFSPRRCPQLWTVEFLGLLAKTLAKTGRLSTYCRSAAVRSALQLADLRLGTIPLQRAALPHEWSQGTVAVWQALDLVPLSTMEQEHLQTRAAVPYRDPELQDTTAVILQRHEQEQQSCGLESTSSWRRRWQIH